MKTEDRLLSAPEAGRRKCCSRQAIAQNIEAGRLNAIRLGRF